MSTAPANASVGPSADRSVDVHAMLDAMPARVTVWDADLRCVGVNGRQLDFLGLTAAEALGRPLREVIGARAVRALGARLRAALAGEPQRWPQESRLPGGSSQVTDCLLLPLAGPEGGVVILAMDATARVHEAEAALSQQVQVQARCERLRTAAALSRHVAVELELAGVALEDLASSDDPDVSYLHVIETLSTGIAALRGRLVELLGEPTDLPSPQLPAPLTLRLQPEVGADKMTAGGVSSERSEEPDRRVAQVLAAFDALPFAVSSWATDSTCTYANPVAHEWYGQADGDMVGRPARELVGDAVYQVVSALGSAALEGGHQRYVRPVTGPSGQDVFAQVDLLPLLEGRRPTGVLSVVRDVTDAVAAQQARAAAEHEVSEMNRRRRLAEEHLDPLLQRLFALTLTLSAVRPSAERSREVGHELESLARELRDLIVDEVEPLEPLAVPWSSAGQGAAACRCTFTGCPAWNYCPAAARADR